MKKFHFWFLEKLIKFRWKSFFVYETDNKTAAIEYTIFIVLIKYIYIFQTNALANPIIPASGFKPEIYCLASWLADKDQSKFDHANWNRNQLLQLPRYYENCRFKKN